MKKHNFRKYFGFIFVAFLFTSCSVSTPTTTSDEEIPKPAVQVIPNDGEVVKEVVFTEVVSQNNCDNSRDLDNIIERSKTIQYALDIGEKITIKADSSIGAGLPGDVFNIEVGVGAEVATNYGVSYGKEETLSNSLTLVTEAGKMMEFTVQHIEQWETGELVITIGQKDFVQPYKFRRGFSIEQLSSHEMECPVDEGYQIPESYTLYDDFNSQDTLNTKWMQIDENEICDLNIDEGQLLFDCKNDTSSDLGAALNPAQLLHQTIGVAATVGVTKVGAPFQLVTSWECKTDGVKRDFHLELGMDSVRAVEYSPIDWSSILLGEINVAANQLHQLQMERSDNNIKFYIDGQPLSLNTPSELSPCFEMVYWSLDFLVWKNGNTLAGQVNHVSILSE